MSIVYRRVVASSGACSRDKVRTRQALREHAITVEPFRSGARQGDERVIAEVRR